MSFTNTEAGVGPIKATLEEGADGSYSTTGAYLSQQGTWKIDLIAQRIGAYDLNYSFEAALTAISNGEDHLEHEETLAEDTSSSDVNQKVAPTPPSESFTLAAIILSIGVAAGSAYSVVRSRQQLLRTLTTLKTN